MSRRIPNAGVILPWEQDAAEDLQIGMGVDYTGGRCVLVFDRHVRTMTFTESGLTEFIFTLEEQLAKLRKGTPPGH